MTATLGTGLPIVQYWHSKDVPEDVAELLATFRDLNPGLSHLVFDEAAAEAFIAEHLGERELAAFRACAVPAMQADYFRYCAIYVLGGICCDADYRCVRPLGELLDMADGGLLFKRDNGAILNGFLVFSAPGHPLLRLVLDVATSNIERRLCERVWWLTGPLLFIVLHALHRDGSFSAVRRDAAARGALAEVEGILQGVGDAARAKQAFEGIQVAGAERATDWIAVPDTRPLYKGSELHWLNWQERGETIFREPVEPRAGA